MQIKHIRTYSFTGTIQFIDEYKVVIINTNKLKKYIHSNYDEEISLEELINLEITDLKPNKSYFNNSVKFVYVKSGYDDNYDNNLKELLNDSFEVIEN